MGTRCHLCQEILLDIALSFNMTDELKKKAIRGGVAKVCAQTTNFVLRVTFIIILARLLNPEDFGLVAMVTAVTGLYGMFTSAGLADAAIQTIAISDKQMSA